MSEPFVWIGPVRHIGGYGEVARGYLSGLQRIGAEVVAVDSHGPVGSPDAFSLEEIREPLLGPVRAEGRTCVYHGSPDSLVRLLDQFPMPGAQRRVACTISETDRLAPSWVANLTPFDEVWVPATFHREVFALSGVPREKLRIVPYGVDADRWAEGATPEAGSDRFRFLYCFQLGWRKGFDLLLEAYLSEFDRGDDVELVLKILPAPPGGPTRVDLVTSIAERVDFLCSDLPRVRVIEDDLGFDAMRSLYQSADLYVSTDRANGWGMPCHEAMACGTPAAAIDWSGATEFMHEANSRRIAPGELIDVDPRLVANQPDYAGQHWPAVDVAAVRSVLREAFDDRKALAELGTRAAREIREHWSLEAAATAMLGRNERTYRSRPGLLDEMLPTLGLQQPSSLLDDARGRVFVCPFDPEREDWRTPLGRYLERYSSADDVTLCLWADADSQDGLDALGQEIGSALTASAPPEGGADRLADVQLTIAPSDHVPWTRVEVDAAFLPPGSRFASATARDGA